MDIDYRLAFDLAPIGLVLSRNRAIVDCNQRLCDMFGAQREQLIGQSFQVLYPSVDEYERTGERIAPILNAKGLYADNRVMSHRTVEIYRARLMRKYRAHTTTELVQKLMAGQT